MKTFGYLVVKPIGYGLFFIGGFLCYWLLIKLLLATANANSEYYGISLLSSYLWFFSMFGVTSFLTMTRLPQSERICFYIFTGIFQLGALWAFPFYALLLDIDAWIAGLISGAVSCCFGYVCSAKYAGCRIITSVKEK